jgi:hypothetical protein
MPVKQEINEALTGTWQIGLFEAPCKAPKDFCLGCFCMCCTSAFQRLELLEFIGEPYVCCGGIFPCGPLGQPQNKNCVWVEACCCTGCSITGTRFLIQTRFDKQNTACDICILWAVCLANWIVCIAQCFVDVPDEIENIVDVLTCIVDGCMLAQQATEIKYQKTLGYSLPNSNVIQVLPPHQQELIQQGKPKQQTMAAGIGAVLGGAAGGAIGADQAVRKHEK